VLCVLVRVLLMAELLDQRLEQHSEHVAIPCAEPWQHGSKICLWLCEQGRQDQVHVLKPLGANEST
jgi:hypothetical protein